MCLFLAPAATSTVGGASAFLSTVGANAAVIQSQLAIYSALATEVNAYQSKKRAGEIRADRARANNAAVAATMSANQTSLVAQEQALSAELDRLTRESAGAQGSAVVQAVEGGVAGGSFQDLVSDFRLVEGEYQRNVALSRQSARAATIFENEALIARARNENDAYRVDYANPSVLRFALNAGVGSLNAFSQYSPPTRGATSTPSSSGGGGRTYNRGLQF